MRLISRFWRTRVEISAESIEMERCKPNIRVSREALTGTTGLEAEEDLDLKDGDEADEDDEDAEDQTEDAVEDALDAERGRAVLLLRGPRVGTSRDVERPMADSVTFRLVCSSMSRERIIEQTSAVRRLSSRHSGPFTDASLVRRDESRSCRDPPALVGRLLAAETDCLAAAAE
jgi:hypothetical protein